MANLKLHVYLEWSGYRVSVKGGDDCTVKMYHMCVAWDKCSQIEICISIIFSPSDVLNISVDV